MDITQDGSKSFMVMYGGQTFKHTSSKVTSHVMTPGEDIAKLTRYLGTEFQTVPGSNAKISASINPDPTGNHGQWYRQSYHMKDGAIFGIKLHSTTNGGVRASSILLLRLRADGPYMIVNAVLGPAATARYQKLPVFQGRADVLTPSEAKHYGINLSKHMVRNLMDQEEVEEDFEISVVDPGTPKPQREKVQTAEGVKEVLVKPMAGRRIRVKR